MRRFTWIHLLLALAVLKLLLHLYFNGLWSFHRDELLYLALGRHLAWGYASVPPSIGFWGWLTGEVLGGSVAVVRFIPTVLGCLTIMLTGLIAKEMLPAEGSKEKVIQAGPLQENKSSFFSTPGIFTMLLVGLTGLLSGALLRPSMLFMPVVFDLFYWTLLCWLFLRFIRTEKPVWLLWFGAGTGFALLNKYSVLILLFSMLPGLLFTKLRYVFSRSFLYVTAALALIIWSPNIAWQVSHQFPVFRHFSELAATQFVHVSLSGFFTDQLLFFLPALPLWVAGLYFLLFHPRAAQWRVFGWMYLVVMSVLLFFGAKSYYSLGAYPVLIAAGAAYLNRLKMTGRVSVLLFILVAGLLSIPVALPLFRPEKEAILVKNFTKIPGFSGILRWEDGNYYPLPQDFADMLGWKEIADLVGKTWQNIPDKTGAAIYAENYGMAGAIGHFGKAYDLPQVWSFSDNYRYWLPDSIATNFQTLIYVNDELGDDMPGYFRKIEEVGRIDMPLSRQHGVLIFLCEQPTPAFFERINTAFERAKKGE